MSVYSLIALYNSIHLSRTLLFFIHPHSVVVFARSTVSREQRRRRRRRSVRHRLKIDQIPILNTNYTHSQAHGSQFIVPNGNSLPPTIPLYSTQAGRQARLLLLNGRLLFCFIELLAHEYSYVDPLILGSASGSGGAFYRKATTGPVIVLFSRCGGCFCSARGQRDRSLVN